VLALFGDGVALGMPLAGHVTILLSAPSRVGTRAFDGLFEP